jgi:hypothetical protein
MVATRLIEGIAAALDAVHAAGWCHADLNGENVLLASELPTHAVLADFDQALGLDEAAPPRGGTSRCSAPERWAGGVATKAGDIYSLGVLAYRCVTGAWPVDTDDAAEACLQHQGRRWAPPSRVRSDLTDALDEVVGRAMAFDPRDRYESGRAFARALEDALGVAPPTSIGLTAGGIAAGGIAAGGVEGLARSIDRLASLVPEDREAFERLLRLAHAGMAEAVEGFAAHVGTLLAPAAALTSFERAGVAGELATSPSNTATLAARVGVRESRLQVLLELLAAVGVVERAPDAVWRLASDYGAVYRARRAVDAPPAAVAEHQAFWQTIPAWLEDYASPAAAGYDEVADVLGALFEGDAAELAGRLAADGGLPPGAVIIDVGAGAGVWGRALARSSASALMIAVDRLDVLAHPGRKRGGVARARCQLARHTCPLERGQRCGRRRGGGKRLPPVRWRRRPRHRARGGSARSKRGAARGGRLDARRFGRGLRRGHAVTPTRAAIRRRPSAYRGLLPAVERGSRA